MRIAIVRSNGLVDNKINRILVSNNFKGDFVDKVTRSIVLNYDFIIFPHNNSLPNISKVIERIVLDKKAMVLLVNKTSNIGQFYNVMNDLYFHIVQEQELESGLVNTLIIAQKYLTITNNLFHENDQLKRKITFMKNESKAKRILMSKGLSEASSHAFIQRKAMDLRTSKEKLVNLIIENKIDI